MPQYTITTQVYKYIFIKLQCIIYFLFHNKNAIEYQFISCQYDINLLDTYE